MISALAFALSLPSRLALSIKFPLSAIVTPPSMIRETAPLALSPSLLQLSRP
jgi:hypothetical protein